MNDRQKRKARIFALRWKQSVEQRRIAKAYAELNRLSTALVDDLSKRLLTLQESFRNILNQLADNFSTNL